MTTIMMRRMVCGMILLAAGPIWAGNIQVSGVRRGVHVPGSHMQIRFNVAWENSWRCDLAGTGQGEPHNRDAAWVFVKYRVSPGGWQHATLAATGHVAPAGAVIDVPTDGMGAFIYRQANGTGTFTANDAQLRWNHAVDGVADPNSVEIRVFAIEMVYVAEGSFAVGSGGAGTSEFRTGGGGSNPFSITSEGAIEVGNTAGKLYYVSSTYGGDQNGPIPAAFPKGYAAFYGMKTEISQGQYCDFLNSLAPAQAANRYSGESTYRQAITTSGGAYTSANWHVACNYLSWADVAAYLDWAGLRPMTELEFEKACRGPRTPVANEFAWGSTNITQATGIANAGAANETAANAEANAVYGGHANVQGPLRVGCMGMGSGNRVPAGAGYWGMLGLSGNLFEYAVTVGNAAGRAFTGLHGNGVLDALGDATVTNWPGFDATGAGWRDGGWAHGSSLMRTSERLVAVSTGDARHHSYGGRGVRSAP